jgi:hypothetical protein
MPSGRIFKNLLFGLLMLAVLFAANVGYQSTQSPSHELSYETYKQIADQSFQSIQSFVASAITWLGERDHDDWLAASFALFAIFTGSIWWSTHRLWVATKESLQLAKQQYEAAHRPRLRVRRIRLEPPETGNPVRVSFEVVNIGDTNARIIRSVLELQVTNLKGESTAHQATPPIPEIYAGETHLIEAEIGPPFQGEWTLNSSMSGRIFISGIIKYQGAMHSMETAFERFYDYKSRRFWPAKSSDPDHEHED